jgi:hypothetical protein
MGIDAMGAARYSKSNVGGALSRTAAKVGRMRKQSMAGETVRNEFTDEERSEMK